MVGAFIAIGVFALVVFLAWVFIWHLGDVIEFCVRKVAYCLSHPGKMIFMIIIIIAALFTIISVCTNLF